MHVLFEISLFISWKNIVRSINTTIQNIFFIVENNYEINFAETTDEIFQGNWKRHPNWWKLSLSRGTKPRGKNEYQRAQMESYYTGILLELVIDHNFIPASELSQIPLIRLYLLIPPSPRLVSKFFTRWKLFETNTHIYIYKLLFFEINLQQISQTFFFLQRRRKSCNSTNSFSEPKPFKSLKKVFGSIVIRMSDNWDTLCN